MEDKRRATKKKKKEKKRLFSTREGDEDFGPECSV